MSESPCCLVTNEYGWSANLERIMQAQALKDNTMMEYMKSPKILEINPDHIIIKGLKDRVTEDKNDKTIKDLVSLLFNTAMLSSGFLLEDPSTFSKLIHRMVVLGLNMEPDDDTTSDLADADENADTNADANADADADAIPSEMEEVD
jgi:molecular chaperone HtpG